MVDLFKGDKPLKIIKLQAENLKRLTAISITPKGNLVQLTGKNRAGKSSCLDAIWWALAGAGNVQAAPIRKGQDRATIKLDLGEVIVTRTFAKNEDGSARTSITVENAEGARFPSPQRMLDSLLGTLTFDPLAFARMKPKEQFDALKTFVPGIDFAAIDNASRGDFERRTAVSRRVRDLAGQIAAIQIPETVPERVDESALVDELAAVGEHNGQIEARKARRDAARREIDQHRSHAEDARKDAEQFRCQAAECDAEAEKLDKLAAGLEQKLAEAPALSEPKDQMEVRHRLDAAKRANLLLDRVEKREGLKQEQRTAEAEAQTLTDRMAAREREKHEAIASAKLPVEGLGFGEDCITLNGLPFDQASDAEQLRTSVAVAMASDPKLRVIRIRDGSLLDDDAIDLLAKMADENDMQVWMERVDSTGKVGIVLEDGHVASTPESRAVAQQAAE